MNSIKENGVLSFFAIFINKTKDILGVFSFAYFCNNEI